MRQGRPRRRAARPDRGRRGGGGESGGGSSSMPHKRNPAAAVLARACARLAHANAGVLLGGEYEHERAAGAWQAEWPALSAALAFTGGAAAAAPALARRAPGGRRADGRERRRRRHRRGRGARRPRARALPGAVVTLHHRFDGPEDAPVVVFSNSLGTTLELWDPQVPAFTPAFRMLRYDQLGHGRSEVPPRPTRSSSSAASWSRCWTSSGSSASRSAACRSAARSGSGSARTRRSGSIGSCSRGPRPTSVHRSGGRSARRR